MRILICILVNNFQLICILVSNTTAFGIPRPILVPFIKIMFVHMQLVRRQAAVARPRDFSCATQHTQPTDATTKQHFHRRDKMKLPFLRWT